MRSCHTAEGLFGAYWDDEATAAEREWLESHFKTCTKCHAEYEQFARTLGAVSELPRFETRPDFTQQVLVAARAAAPVADTIRPAAVREVQWAPIAAAAAFALVAAVSAYTVFGTRPAADSIAQNEPRVTPSVTQQVQPVAVTSSSSEPVADPRVTGPVAVVTDSLFDHSADVEFMLEPVQLRRGRAHTGSRLPDGVQGDQVVITF